MDNFKLIYRILKILANSMEVEEFEYSLISAESLGITEPYWGRIMQILVDSGYVKGISVWNAIDCNYPRAKLVRPEITLKGLEYLEENSLMKKAANIAKGIKDIVPGI